MKICFELKTRGTTRFDKAVGFQRAHWSRKEPQGPTLKDILQGSLNALAGGADVLIIGIIATEAISKDNAEKIDASVLDRFIGEWHYSREEFEPLALAELERMGEIKNWLDNDTLPPRWGLNDLGYSVELDPDARNHSDRWQCVYCSYRSMCQFVGPNPVSLPIPGLKEWMKGDLAGLLEVSRHD